jgi:hypothetical protein
MKKPSVTAAFALDEHQRPHYTAICLTVGARQLHGGEHQGPIALNLCIIVSVRRFGMGVNIDATAGGIIERSL